MSIVARVDFLPVFVLQNDPGLAVMWSASYRWIVPACIDPDGACHGNWRGVDQLCMVHIMQARFMLQESEIYMLVALMNHDQDLQWMVERHLSCESRLC